MTETTLIALGLLALAAFFGYRQWVEIRAREQDLDAPDRDYFARKDRRRLAGSAIMAVMSTLMLVSARVDARKSPAHGRLWGWLWLLVLVLVIALLVLAFFDWRANTRYAIRHRRALLDEQRDYLASLKRGGRTSLPPTGSNGHPPGSSPSRPSSH
jgi:hypothetical protein